MTYSRGLSGIDSNSTAEDKWEKYLGNAPEKLPITEEVSGKGGDRSNTIMIACVVAAAGVIAFIVAVVVVSLNRIILIYCKSDRVYITFIYSKTNVIISFPVID